MTHRDVFNRFVRPTVSEAERKHWDNLSQDKTITETTDGLGDDEKDGWKSFDDCRKTCEKKQRCIQYSHESGMCKLGNVIRLGHAVVSKGEEKKGAHAGWMWDRIKDFAESMEPCTPLWIM